MLPVSGRAGADSVLRGPRVHQHELVGEPRGHARHARRVGHHAGRPGERGKRCWGGMIYLFIFSFVLVGGWLYLLNSVVSRFGKELFTTNGGR